MDKLLLLLKKLIIIVSIALVTNLVYSYVQEKISPTVYKTYSEFYNDVDEGKVFCVKYSSTGEKMEVFLNTDEVTELSYSEKVRYPLSKFEKEDKYFTYYPATDNFRQYLLSKNVLLKVGVAGGNMLSSLLFRILETAILIYVCFSLLRATSYGKIFDEDVIVEGTGIITTFKDIVGLDEITVELNSIVELLNVMKNTMENITIVNDATYDLFKEAYTYTVSDKSEHTFVNDLLVKLFIVYQKAKMLLVVGYKKRLSTSNIPYVWLSKLGLLPIVEGDTSGSKLKVKPPKGILLVGQPGTGKTAIGRAIAGEAKCNYYYVNASRIEEMFVGLGAKRIRDVYAKARKNSPCVVFIDEIDAIGGKRSNLNRGNDTSIQTLDALLQELDGFTRNTGIITIAATNHPELLSSALIRSGRFDRQIVINPPSTVEKVVEMFKHFLVMQRVDNAINLKVLARVVLGMTGADIESICNQAALDALLNGRDTIMYSDFISAIDKLQLKGNPVTIKEEDYDVQEIICYHESGHAVMHYLLGDKIACVTVQGTTSGVGGYVRGYNDAKYQSKTSIENHIMVLYGGRISEEIKFGISNVTVGAMNDIDEATNYLNNYVNVLSFSSTDYLVNLNKLYQTNDSQTTIKEVSKQLVDRTRKLLSENYDLVEALANELKKKPRLDSAEVIEVFDNVLSKRDNA